MSFVGVIILTSLDFYKKLINYKQKILKTIFIIKQFCSHQYAVKRNVKMKLQL